MHIVNVGYNSTNYYVLADSKPRLLIDAGWPGTMTQFQHQCKRMGIEPASIPHLLVTHFHPDHAGLAQELKQMGCKLVLVENQVSFVPLLKSQMKGQEHSLTIDLKDNVIISLENSRAFLERLGIQGEIIATPGHSDDSVTLVLDEGAAFTGDLTHPMLLTDDSDLSHESWKRIRALGVKTIYPGHGPVYPLRVGGSETAYTST